MAVEVFVADEQTGEPVDASRWAGLARSVLLAEGAESDTELSVLFVDEDAMAQLNKRFLDREGPTDVLAFPIEDEPQQGGRYPDTGGTGPGWVPPDESDMPTLVGDVVICPSVAHRNATDQSSAYEDELALLVVHGTLHLLGMDHLDDEEAAAMERREQELLERFHRKRVPHRAAARCGEQGEEGDRERQ